MKKPTIIFMGTPIFATNVLSKLIECFDVIAVVTMPSRPVGRKKVITPSPINILATSHQIPVFTPEKVGDIFPELSSLAPDFIISCAYGQIIPTNILDIPKYFALNVHASLLPKYRGAAPIQRAIMAGETETGITIMEMEAGLDTGNMFKTFSIKIDDNDNFQTIHDKLSSVGADLIVDVVRAIINNQYMKTPQDNSQATYANKIIKEDEVIDFNQPTMNVYNHIRALNPIPGALAADLAMKLYDINYEIQKHQLKPGTLTLTMDSGLRIATLDGYIIVKSLKVIGKGLISDTDYLNQTK